MDIKKIDRPLIAYAYLAQAAPTDGDLLSGLAPIFQPIASARVGQIFDPTVFIEDVSRTYGMEVHPWAAEDLAPRLEKAGIVVREHVTDGVHQYRYKESTQLHQDVTEGDIQEIVKKFIEFSTPLLERHGLPVNHKALEKAFLEQVIYTDFVAALAKPDRANSGFNTLGLPKKPGQVDLEKEWAAKAKVEYLCAAFILETSRNNKQSYELLVRIANGAILSQVVLDIREPTVSFNLSGLTVVLDTPFVMSLLELTAPEAEKYAKSLCEKLKSKGAKVAIFRHSVEELQDNLNAVVAEVTAGRGHRATARRYKESSVFRSYATSVSRYPELALTRNNIEVLDVPGGNLFAHFTEADETSLNNRLGVFWNRIAQERDAASIAAIVRYRRGKSPRMSAFPSAEYIFVTENQTLVAKSNTYLAGKSVYGVGEVPPAVVDKYLAGLLWIMFGGTSENLTNIRLLANCASALEPRNDVCQKVLGFLQTTSDLQAEHFRALMTTERPGQHLMELTLGDSNLVNQNNYQEIIQKIELSATEKIKEEFDKQLSEIKKIHAEESDLRMRALIELDDQRRSEEIGRVQSEVTVNMLQKELADSGQEIKRHKEDALNRDLLLVEKAVDNSVRYHRSQHVKLAYAVGLWVVFLGLLMPFSSSTLSIALIIGSGCLATIAFGNMPEFLFGKYLGRLRSNIYFKRINELELNEFSTRVSIDWQTGKVSIAELRR